MAAEICWIANPGKNTTNLCLNRHRKMVFMHQDTIRFLNLLITKKIGFYTMPILVRMTVVVVSGHQTCKNLPGQKTEIHILASLLAGNLSRCHQEANSNSKLSYNFKYFLRSVQKVIKTKSSCTLHYEYQCK